MKFKVGDEVLVNGQGKGEITWVDCPPDAVPYRVCFDHTKCVYWAEESELTLIEKENEKVSFTDREIKLLWEALDLYKKECEYLIDSIKDKINNSYRMHK